MNQTNATVEEAQPLARIIECSEKEYHADPCAVASLSQSIGHILVSKSPVHAWAAHPKLGKLLNGDEDDDGSDEKAKWAKTAGTVIHKLLLGKGAAIEVVEAKDWRTNYAKDLRDTAKAAGRIPILTHKYQDLVDATDYIRDVLRAKGFEFDGQSEVAFEWREDGERGPVVCRGRMDHIHLDRPQILDVKKIRSAHPDTISRHIYEYGYDIQDTAYRRALAAYLREHGQAVDPIDVDMVFLFMEEKPPYAITPVRLSPAFLEIGRQRWERAIFAWERCLATNRWPDYADGIVGIEPQPWVLQREIGNGSW
jgi:hypothetical protein